MIEIAGDLWEYYGRPGYTVCITTNGFLRPDGSAVMGRGCALEAKKRIRGIERKLGIAIQLKGNVVQKILTGDLLLHPIISFPVKHNWWEKADPALIVKSASELSDYIKRHPSNYVLPRPGCGNGGLKWDDVKPLIEFLPDSVMAISYEFGTTPLLDSGAPHSQSPAGPGFRRGESRFGGRRC